MEHKIIVNVAASPLQTERTVFTGREKFIVSCGWDKSEDTPLPIDTETKFESDEKFSELLNREKVDLRIIATISYPSGHVYTKLISIATLGYDDREDCVVVKMWPKPLHKLINAFRGTTDYATLTTRDGKPIRIFAFHTEYCSLRKLQNDIQDSDERWNKWKRWHEVRGYARF